ncbi:Bacteroides conjugative transposon TraJ protein [Porphyromonadaceae bacterium KH3CP3RA]|nr:Bacteroides conjugative transposon TraJ protein [Porphyromonadaceae bacterium KH3CP3RA]
MDFDNLHQILAELYNTMIHLCEDMIGVSKGLAGLGALFYVAYRVWQALSRAEPIDVFPLLRPFALGLCIMFFPTIVLGTINAVLSPVVKGTHSILETQTIDLNIYQQQKDMLEYEARVREGKAWLVDNDEFEKRMKSLGITEASEIGRMFGERLSYDIKMWFRDVLRDLFELMFKAAALVIDTLRTFFLLVLSILGPLAFAFAVYDGFQATLTQWLARYISVYLWLPISDIFSSILARIQTLMIESDLKQLSDPNFIPDGSSGLYIVFLIIGIIGYFTVPTVAGWIVHSGGTGAFGGAVNKTASRAGGIAGGLAGSMSGNVGGRLLGK